MRSSIWSKRRISPSQGHRTARSSSVLFRASWTCATARVTDRPVPSSHGRARTTTIPPVGAGGPAWEPPDGLWGTSTSTRAMTQASTANAPDFFSTLLGSARHADEVEDVVPGREQHQHDHDGEPDPEADLLRALAQRPAAHGLDGVEQQVAAVEKRDREQVDEADRDREHRHEADEPAEAPQMRHLPRNLGDPDRARELIGRFPPDDELADVVEGALHHVPGLLDARPQRAERPVGDGLEVS